MNLRAIIESEPHSAFENMARDEAILECMRTHHDKKDKPPVLRLYRWKEPGAISLGVGESIDKLNKNTIKFRKNKIPIVRRFTAGYGVYHGPDDFTYSFTIPQRKLPPDFPYKGKGIGESRMVKQYQYILKNYIIKALDSLGIKSEYRSWSHVLVNGELISGSSMFESIRESATSVFFIHGTLLNNYNHTLMKALFKEDVDIETIGINEIDNSLGREQVNEALIQAFSDGKEIMRRKNLNLDELIKAKRLLDEKYSFDNWNLKSGKVSRGNCYKPPKLTIQHY